MSDSSAVVHRSWLQRYWFFVLRVAIWLGLTTWLGILLVHVDAAIGIAVVLFMFEMGVGNAMLGLVSRAYQQQAIDSKEATRRTWMIFSGQVVLLAATAVVLLFSAFAMAALLPVLYLPARAFFVVRLHSLYGQEPSGKRFRKGMFD